jgi:GMP synthase-like glutamine amidotransferase
MGSSMPRPASTGGVLVLQHADWEVPGYFGDVLGERAVGVRVIRPDLGEPLPAQPTGEAILAMGGPMSVNDDADLPWLRDEKRFIAEAVAAGTPYLGACLGAQLLAAALGARVYPGPRPEYGMHAVELTSAAATDPVFGGLPAHLEVFQWHGETFDLPDGAVALAGSAGYPHQAMRVGERAYGLQFHLEVTVDLLDRWLAVPGCLAEARRALGPDAGDELRKELAVAEAGMLAVARHVCTNWLGLIPHG